jgi:NADH-quinone oxidoreductase subunit E
MSELLPKHEIAALKAKAAALAHPQEMIVDVLREIQSHHGWVPDSGVELTAEILGTTPVAVEEIATFYDKIFRQPVGRRVIHVCDSICCWANGGDQIADHLRKVLEVDFGETTADGQFTLLPTCCLGACGDAPAMMIGLKTYGPLTIDMIDEILAQERAKAEGSGQHD